MDKHFSAQKLSNGKILFICMLGLHFIVAVSSIVISEGITTKESSLKSTSDELKNSNVDLEKAETKGSPVEIIKQIKKVNDDGSYTVGYEAEDGTFKIESRDVLGNVKGTFGYIDLNGEIKRITYTSNNETGIKTDPFKLNHDQENQSQKNKTTSSTRRPVFNNNRSSIVQSIPRRLRVLPSPSSATTSSTENTISSALKEKITRNGDPTTTIVYATSVPTSKSYVYIRPTPLPGTQVRQSSEQQIIRPEKLDLNREQKSIVSEIDDKDEQKNFLYGKAIRRKLIGNTDDSQETSSSTSLPLHSATSKKPTLLLQARQRVAKIENISANSRNNENFYVRPQQTSSKKPDDPTTESTSEQAYLTQIPLHRSINKYKQQNGKEQEYRVLRKIDPRAQNFENIYPQEVNLPEPITENGDQIERRKPTEPEAATIHQMPLHIYGRQISPPSNYFYPMYQQEQRNNHFLQPYRIPYAQPEPPTPFYYDNAEFANNQERPLTAVDFEKLLRLLILRHQYLIQNTNPYQHPSYINEYQAQFVRPNRPIQPAFYNPYDRRIPYNTYEAENSYQAQNPVLRTNLNSGAFEIQRMLPRKQPNNRQYYKAQSQEEYLPAISESINLPADVREELLYRMLMLALNPNPQRKLVQNSNIQSGRNNLDVMATKSTIHSLRKPVRSVQILGEEH